MDISADKRTPVRPSGIDIKGKEELCLKEALDRNISFFESRGWHVVYTGKLLALTVSNDVFSGAQENIRVISIFSFRFSATDQKSKGTKKFWETTTYWGEPKRIYSENFTEIWDRFIAEQANYDPRRMAWSHFTDEYKATRRMRLEDKTLAIIADILGIEVTTFQYSPAGLHLDVFTANAPKRFCALYLNPQNNKNVKIYTGKRKEEVLRITAPEDLKLHTSRISTAFKKYRLRYDQPSLTVRDNCLSNKTPLFFNKEVWSKQKEDGVPA